MQRAVSVVRLALSIIGRSQQKQCIMFYNTVVLEGRALPILWNNATPPPTGFKTLALELKELQFLGTNGNSAPALVPSLPW